MRSPQWSKSDTQRTGDSSVPSGKGALQRGGLSLHHIQVPNRVPAAALGMQDRAHVPKEALAGAQIIGAPLRL